LIFENSETVWEWRGMAGPKPETASFSPPGARKVDIGKTRKHEKQSDAKKLGKGTPARERIARTL